MLIRRFCLCACLALVACAPSDTEQSEAAETAEAPLTLIPGTPAGDLDRWVGDIRTGIAPLLEEARTNGASAQAKALNLYVTRQEYIEMYYGPGGKLQASPELGAEIEKAEANFHQLMQVLGTKPVDLEAAAQAITALDAQQARVLETWQQGEQRLDRSALTVAAVGGARGVSKRVEAGSLQTSEISAIVGSFNDAAAAYQNGDVVGARALVLSTYLELFEPIESRLPGGITSKVEHLIHVEIRPAIERAVAASQVTALINEANTELIAADTHLARGGSYWFAAFNSFAIILREGLEAVLLVGALLAYLAATGASARHRRQIWGGVVAGLAATAVTWFAARSLIPITGANRELIEGITALVAVVVLLYVSNWMFQKTYIHDWKNYLRNKLDAAVSSKSAFAMMVLAFAAVYREGFETVLFYQALMFDASAAAVMSGFVPGMLLIVGIGVLIIRAGMKLPIKQMFAVTNSILVYLAFVFVGKGIYNLHEAGAFAATPLPLPDVTALRLLFGWYPLVETTVAQIAYAALITATFIYYRRRLAPAVTLRNKAAA